VMLGLILGYMLVMNKQEKKSFYANAKHILARRKAGG
jgi:hypothetical protein